MVRKAIGRSNTGIYHVMLRLLDKREYNINELNTIPIEKRNKINEIYSN